MINLGLTAPRASFDVSASTFLRATLLTSKFPSEITHSMSVVWVVLIGFTIVDTIWIFMSPLSFAPGNWSQMLHVLVTGAVALGVCGFISHRLTGRNDIGARLFVAISDRIILINLAFVVFALLASVVIVFCCLAASLALPLKDAALAELDARIGFDWIGFVELMSTSSLVKWALEQSYYNTAQIVFITMIWLCISNRTARLSEMLALLCMTAVGLALGMLILPAAGAYTLHKLPDRFIGEFGADAGLWHYNLLMQFRSAVKPVIDFSTPNINGLVTFPSGHTMLGLVTTYAMRDRLFTFIPAIAANGLMIISTLPVGGHYLIDVIVSAGITVCSVLLLHFIGLRNSSFSLFRTKMAI